ncbi:hypothetical protein CHS0354_005153 [Potamilus streckersoni]|uniref:Uncharacterized protein n=1 Tax=Potamilus streckersoni TaxID=2493646 RepID=A0AAE0VKJ0_9BIVA|nr:hypothetical protein CHS0354_005153 [Potamilus streckersoni]
MSANALEVGPPPIGGWTNQQVMLVETLKATIQLVAINVGKAARVDGVATPTPGATLIIGTTGTIVASLSASMTLTTACVVIVARIMYSVVMLVQQLPLEMVVVLGIHVAITSMNTFGAILITATYGSIAVIQTKNAIRVHGISTISVVLVVIENQLLT